MNRKHSKKTKGKDTPSTESAPAAADAKIFPSEMKKKNKKAAKTTLIVLLVSTAVMTLLYFLPYDRILAAMFPEKSTNHGEGIHFYPADFETDILSDAEYTSLGRYLAVKTGSETVFIFDDDDAEGHGDVHLLLWQYLQALINGDAKGYNALFSEEYLSEHGEQKSFPMQRLYDITATCYSEHTFTAQELDGKYEGVTQYRFELLYCIQYNDGSIRRDVGSDEARPIYLEILKDREGSSLKINSISYGR